MNRVIVEAKSSFKCTNNNTIIIGSKMFCQPILLLMVFHGVCSYYLYNPYTHDILVLSSLANVPSGYKLIPPPYQRRSSERDDQAHIGQCSDPGFICTEPYDSSQTYQFHCSKDSQCPHFYKCCRHRCFTHRICVKATIQRVDINRNPQNYNLQRRGTCEKWPYSCSKPYHQSLTSIFKCENDKQCPRNFKCCQQSCFKHKICSKAIVREHEYVEEIRRDEIKDIKITPATETDENDLNNLSTTDFSTAETDEEIIEVKTTPDETTKTEITNVERTEGETHDYDTGDETTEVKTIEEVEELKSTTSDKPDIESTESTQTTTETATETTYGDNDVGSELEPTAEISPSESTSHSYDSNYSSEITAETEYVPLNSTEQEINILREKPGFRNPTPDPNAIIPEYSEFYQYYDYQNETEYDTDSTYS